MGKLPTRHFLRFSKGTAWIGADSAEERDGRRG